MTELGQRLDARSRVRSDYLLVFLLIVVGVVVYLPRLWAVEVLQHDDAISIMQATCNGGRYLETMPSGRWVSVSDWQQYWSMNGSWCIEQIRHDLANFDIHPPLYFWLLHLWFGVFGISIHAALGLNLVFLALATAFVFVACRVYASRSISFVATLLWLLSLSTRTTVGLIRQYTLFTMLTALLLLLVLMWLKRARVGWLVGIGVVLLAGTLTHYQFVIAAAFTVAFAMAICWKRGERRQVGHLAIISAVAAVTFCFAHPDFLRSFHRSDEQAQVFSFLDVPSRIARMAWAPLQALNPFDWYHPIPDGLLDWGSPLAVVVNLLNVLAGGVGAFYAVRLIVRAIRKRRVGDMVSVDYLPIFTAIASWLAVVAMYLTWLSPKHAYGLQYFHFITPFLFVGLAQAVGSGGADDVVPRKLRLALTPIILVAAIAATAVTVAHRSESDSINDIKHADALILDSVRRGVLPTVLWHADPATRVYAASQDDLLASFPDTGGAETVYYVTSNDADNNTSKRDLILQKLAQSGYKYSGKLPAGVVPLVLFRGEVVVLRR